jgi:hypothetical protein
MTLKQRLELAKQKPAIRPDNDPDLCRLQALWVRSRGSEAGFEPVLRRFKSDPHARLSDYIQQYDLTA